MKLDEAIERLQEEQGPLQQERNALAVLEELPKEVGKLPIKDPKGPKRLQPVHKYILVLHLKGFKGTVIAQMLNTSTSVVYSFLRSDIARQLADDYHSFVDDELAALYDEAVNAVRRGLRSDDPDIYLKAAQMFFNVGKAKKKDGGETAEDYISRIIELSKEGQVTRIEETRRVSGGNGDGDEQGS